MSDISFVLDADESAALELKLGQYMVGQKGEQGQDGQQGPPGTLTPEDEALLAQAVSDANAAASQAAGSASSASQSATSAKTSETNAKASETASAANATAAAGSAGDAASSANTASASAATAKTSETNAAAWEALAKDWATKTTGTVDGVDYSAKYYAQQTVSSAQAASNSAAAAAGSASAASGSAGQAATSATNAANSAAAAAASAGQAANKVDKGGDTMTGDLNLYAASGNYSPNIKLKAPGYTPAIRASGPSQQIEFINGAYTTVNVTISDAGDISTRGNATVGGASLHMQPQGGGGYASFLDFHPNAGQIVRLGAQNDATTKEFFITNAANNARNLRVDDGGNMTARGNISAQGQLFCTGAATFGSKITCQNAMDMVNQLTINGVSGSAGQLSLQSGDGNSHFYVRGRNTGGYEYVNNAYNAVVATVDDAGTMTAANYFTGGQVRATGVQYGQPGTALLHYDAGGGNIAARTGGAYKYFTFQSDGNANANNGSWVSSSSGTLKTNVRQLTGALARLLALTGISYTRTDDPTEKTRLGFIAEDVQAVYPELVYSTPALDAPAPDTKGNPTGDAVAASLSLALGEFAAPIVEALREIAARLDALDGGGAG